MRGGREGNGRRERSASEKNNMVENKTPERSESVLRWHLVRNLDGTAYSQAHTKLPDVESRKNFLQGRPATQTELFHLCLQSRVWLINLLKYFVYSVYWCYKGFGFPCFLNVKCQSLLWNLPQLLALGRKLIWLKYNSMRSEKAPSDLKL